MQHINPERGSGYDTGAGLTNPAEGTPLQALASVLPLADRIRMQARLAIGTFRSYVQLGAETVLDGAMYAGNEHEKRMRQLGGEIVYDTLQEHPELFKPERLLKDN
ncbi:MAG TPA: hypothetical protein VHA37_01490 [Candidatus Saccharimonadales bacterium]|nr:hypothetical protein [Candidatus Saccharimonadales bacterium]